MVTVDECDVTCKVEYQCVDGTLFSDFESADIYNKKISVKARFGGLEPVQLFSYLNITENKFTTPEVAEKTSANYYIAKKSVDSQKLNDKIDYLVNALFQENMTKDSLKLAIINNLDKIKNIIYQSGPVG